MLLQALLLFLCFEDSPALSSPGVPVLILLLDALDLLVEELLGCVLCLLLFEGANS